VRKLIFAFSALGLAAPAVAQDAPVPPAPRAPADEEMVRNLPDPREIEAVGDALGRVADVLMDVKVGPIAEAVDPGRKTSRRERERTLGDVASRDDPYLRERIRDSIEAMSAGLGGMIEQLAVLTPVLRRTLEDTRERVGEAIRDRGSRRDDARDHDGDSPRRD